VSSLKQIQANRLNALKSTGPRSDAGKAAIRFNALKSGIEAHSEVLPTEDPSKLEALVAEYYARWSPRAPEVRALVDACVRNEWLLGRLNRVESSIYKYNEEDAYRTTEFRDGRMAMQRDKNLDRLQRRLNAAQRNLQSALKDLARVKAAELAEEAAEPAAPSRIQPQSAQWPEPENGFVPPRADSGPAPTPPEGEIGPNGGAGDALHE
jgi:hypothetical protein